MADNSLSPSNWLGFELVGANGESQGGGTFGNTSPLTPIAPLNNIFSGTTPTTLASVPNLSSYLSGSSPTSGSSSGGTAPNATVGNQSGSDTASAAAPGSVQNYFTRAVIVIMGFIFLAVGLNMIKPGVVPNPVSHV